MFFLFAVVFTFAIDNIRINYRTFNLVSTLIPAIVLSLGYGPYTAGAVIGFLSLLRINSHSRIRGLFFIKAIARSSIYFLMYTLPAELMYLDIPLYLRLLLYLVSVLSINQFIMLIYFRVFYNNPWNGYVNNLKVYLIELTPGLLMLPLSQAIYDLQLSGYDKIFTLYYLFPVVSMMLLLFTIIMKQTDSEMKNVSNYGISNRH